MSALTMALAFCLALGDDVVSGPMVGDKLQEFKVQGFSGPQEGKEYDVIKETKGGPTVLVVVQQITRPAFQLMRPIDDFAAKHDKLATHFIWLGEKEKMEEFLKRAKGSLNIQSPMSIGVDANGPMTYGFNDRAQVTILVAKDNKVVANFAFADPNATVVPKVLAAAAKVIGVDPPKVEEKKKRPDPGKKGERSEELSKLMRELVSKDTDQAAVDRIVAAMRKWAGDDAPKQAELREFAAAVLRRGAGTEAAQAALKKLAE